MSKQLLINERPADNNIPSYGGGLGGGDDWPKASIGNYKGVMLCNRPNEMGLQRKADRGGNLPFNSRVTHEEPVGWNPCKKVFPRSNRKRIDPNNALLKHKRFLRGLEEQKVKEKEEREREEQDKEIKVKKFKDNASKQRNKIYSLKKDETLNQNEEEANTDPLPKARLTEENLKKNEEEIKKSQRSKAQSQVSKKPKGGKPAWAMTEKDVEE